MSGGDDPFGRSDRTIIRPNPGGRLPQTPAPQTPPPSGSSAASVDASAGTRAQAVRVASRGSALTPGAGLGRSVAPASSSAPSCRPAFPGSHVCRVYDPNTGRVVGYQYVPGTSPGQTR